MVINGRYKLVKNEHFVEYLKALGPEITEPIAKRIDNAATVLTVTVDGHNYNIHSDSGSPDTSSNLDFNSDHTFEENLITGHKVTTTAIVKGDTITLSSVGEDGRSGDRIYEFSKDGLTITYKSPDSSTIVAKRIFKRE